VNEWRSGNSHPVAPFWLNSRIAQYAEPGIGIRWVARMTRSGNGVVARITREIAAEA